MNAEFHSLIVPSEPHIEIIVRGDESLADDLILKLGRKKISLGGHVFAVQSRTLTEENKKPISVIMAVRIKSANVGTKYKPHE